MIWQYICNMYNKDKHTTVTESRTLLKLGVDPSTASYQWHNKVFSENNGEGTPVWGIWDLMVLLPENIKYNGKDYMLNSSTSGIDYYCFYDNSDIGVPFYDDDRKKNYYEAVVWLKKNDIMLNGEKKYGNSNKKGFENLLGLLAKK